MNRPLIYIAGKISDLPPGVAEKNFHDAQVRLENQGWDTLNPYARIEGWKKQNEDYKEIMRLVLQDLASCKHAYFLRGWERSLGATFEHFVCQKTGIKIIYEEQPKEETVEI
jgi:hypothetical protein